MIIYKIFIRLFLLLQLLIANSVYSETTKLIRYSETKNLASSCTYQSVQLIKNNNILSLVEKKILFKQLSRKCQQYQRVSSAALADIYFATSDYQQAKKYYALSYQHQSGFDPINLDETKLKYALSLHFLNKQPVKVRDIFFQMRDKYTDHLPKNLLALYKRYKISMAGKIIPQQLIVAALSSTKSYKNLQICPAINVIIHFDYDRATIKDESREQIGEILLALKNPQLASMGYQYELVGHTDARGDENYNLHLSRHRAKAVKQALVQLYPALEKQLITIGKGESELELEGDSEQIHQLNRRVEVRVACDE